LIRKRDTQKLHIERWGNEEDNGREGKSSRRKVELLGILVKLYCLLFEEKKFEVMI